MWSSGLEELKKLNVSDAEVAQLVAMKNAGVSDDMCVALVTRRTSISIRLPAPKPRGV